MKETAVIQALKTISKEELKKLDKFLRSPYFTEGKNISSKILYRYFEILKQHYPRFANKELSDKIVFLKLYPSGKANVKIIRKLNSDLLKLIESFLAQQEYEKKETEFRQNVLHQLAERKIEKVFHRRFGEMLVHLETLEKDEDYFYETYSAWNNYWSQYFLSKSVYKLEDSIKHINSFFIYVVLGSLRIYLWGLSFLSGFLKIPNVQYEFYLYEEVVNHVEQNYKTYKDIPQILVHFNLIKMITTRDEKYYYSLQDLKNRYFDKFTNTDKCNIFVMMTNFCQRMISQGSLKYRNERFLLDKEFLMTGLVDWLGGIHFFQFLSITKNALKLRKFNWVEKTVDEFNPRIEPRYRTFAVNYIKALIHFEKKNYDKSLELLSKLKIEYSHQKQYTRNLMLQIHFEKGDDETSLSLIDTSRHFIHRDKHLDVETKKNSLNFLGYTEKLIKGRDVLSAYLLLKIKNEVENQPGVENKGWLLEKIEGLK